jgi:hypothetical protein
VDRHGESWTLLMTGLLHRPYSMNQASYDLSRLARNGLITRVPGRNRYTLTCDGLLFACFYTKVYDHLLRPLMAPDRPNASPNSLRRWTPSTSLSPTTSPKPAFPPRPELTSRSAPVSPAELRHVRQLLNAIARCETQDYRPKPGTEGALVPPERPVLSVPIGCPPRPRLERGLDHERPGHALGQWPSIPFCAVPRWGHRNLPGLERFCLLPGLALPLAAHPGTP